METSHLDDESMKKIASEIQQNPSDEIPKEFFLTLENFNTVINNSTIDEICESYGFIPQVLSDVVSKPFVSAKKEVSDLLAESFLSFILNETDDPRSPAPWAAQQLLNITKRQQESLPLLKCKKIQCKESIFKYPKEYAQQLSDNSLIQIAEIQFDGPIFDEVINELDERDIPIPENLFYSIDPSKISPKGLINYFCHFIESPTFSIAHQIFNAFLVYPTIHLVCLNYVYEYPKSKTQRAFEMIGKIISNELPLEFSLSYFYHPSIKEFIDEVEFTGGNPENADVNVLADVIRSIGSSSVQFLIPFLFEMPQWIELIQKIDEQFFALTMKIINEKLA